MAAVFLVFYGRGVQQEIAQGVAESVFSSSWKFLLSLPLVLRIRQGGVLPPSNAITLECTAFQLYPAVYTADHRFRKVFSGVPPS